MKKNLFFLYLFINLLFFITLPSKTYARDNDPEIDRLCALLDQAGNVKSAIKLANKFHQEAKRTGNTKMLVWSYNAMAGLAFDSGNFERVLEIGTQAKAVNLKLNNKTFTTHLFTLMAGSYMALGFCEEGRKMYDLAKIHAEQIADLNGRHYRLGQIYTGLAFGFESDQKKLDSVLYYYKKGYKEYKKISNDSKYIVGLSLSESNIAGKFLDAKQYDSARKYLKVKGEAKRKFKSRQTEMLKLGNFATLYYENGDYKKALKTLKEVLFLSDSLHAVYIKKFAYNSLSKVYAKLNDADQEKVFLLKYTAISDSLARVEKEAIRKPLAGLLKEKELHNAHKSGRYTLILLIFLPLFFLSLYTGFILFRKYRKTQLASLEQGRLMEEKVQMLEQAGVPGQKNEEEEMRTVVQMAIANDPAFFTKFNKFDQAFTKKVLEIAPNLVASELEFCALLRLNFETKEIARYTGLSVRAVEGKKYRVRKKLRISSEEDINIWMTRL
ncbi:tetratricopeptide repeat protein [Pedobacter steynii]|uniref:HTH luxR-type domain-containing protein n=1 Tax=Pedobacter steynii TaxID=430522 RepID=A0A1D7QBU4_9SPHI|nr:hypothetical protein [Pedobacter steynii]AOM76170.1 hypothetical protein BFS30_02705 [Pedobacter steynii]